MNRKILSLIVLLAPFFVFAQTGIEGDSVKPAVTATDSTDELNPDEDVPEVSLSESDLAELETAIVAANAWKDPFVSATSFTFSSARFRVRGYNNKNFVTFINGAPVNDLETGRTAFGNWGGLNPMFRNRETSFGLQPNTFAYGEPGGGYSLNARASKQRKQFQVSYANTNRNYRHRLLATYSTGLMKSGWAVSAALSRRWAKEGYIQGTFYDGTSYFLGVEKHFKSGHNISLTAFGSSVRDGKAAAPLRETIDLMNDHYYNRFWGWQDGKKRNSIIGNVFQPTFILAHDWKMNKHENMTTSASFTFGKRERSNLEGYNSMSPRTDYYRYLPSYQDDSTTQILVAYAFQHDPGLNQHDWAGWYEANAMNYDSVDNIEGIAGNKIVGTRARYYQFNEVSDMRKFNFASTYNNAINEHIAITTGIIYQFQRTENYERMLDLLGADYSVDVNQFAERDFPDSFSVAQNDLNHPNRIIRVGDKFGYDYFITNHKANVWAQSVFTYNKVDFFIAADFSLNAYWRYGKTRYGLRPDNSEGRSAVRIFPNGGVKGGVTYKINRRNYLYVTGTFESRAPVTQDAFTSPRTSNSYVNDLQSETIYSGELGYVLRTPSVNIKADMYYTQFNNETQVRRFYHDDFRTNVSYSLTGIDTRHWGGELGIEAKIWRGFSASAAASIGRYTYISRPAATITYDNNPALTTHEKIYWKNFNVGGTPQLATTFAIKYRAPTFWFANINFNYYDWMWVNVNPARRTEAAVDLVDPNSQNFANIVNQERLKGQFTMDISVGYSWMLNGQFKNLKRRYFLVFNASVANVTNNRNLITGASEQLRFDYFEKNVNKFPTRYTYAYGATYFVSVAFRMQ